MKDRYLYKAKRIDNGEWVEGYYLSIQDKTYIVCEAEIQCIDGENADLYATEWYEVDHSTIRIIGSVIGNPEGRWCRTTIDETYTTVFGKPYIVQSEKYKEARTVIDKALEEIQKYCAIGTVEECKLP